MSQGEDSSRRPRQDREDHDKVAIDDRRMLGGTDLALEDDFDLRRRDQHLGEVGGAGTRRRRRPLELSVELGMVKMETHLSLRHI
jgi:hypothetical protein